MQNGFEQKASSSAVMYGGYSLLQLLNKANAITPFRLTWFRAGHAHAGVLLIDVAAVLLGYA
jgi:hypothetical protein